MSDTPEASEWVKLTVEEKTLLHPSRLGRAPTKKDVADIIATRPSYEKQVNAITLILGDVTEGCVDPVRAEKIASLAIELALRNLEGK